MGFFPPFSLLYIFSIFLLFFPPFSFIDIYELGGLGFPLLFFLCIIIPKDYMYSSISYPAGIAYY
jgi:hypothetical protein